MQALSWLFILAAIWGPVIFLLGAQWTVHPEYHYGWIVPVLCLYLAWERSHTAPAPAVTTRRRTAIVVLIVAGVLFGLARLLQESNPVWRGPSWILACAAVAMTLATLYLLRGERYAAHFGFPILFFLLAVPWPNIFEHAVVRFLTWLNTAGVIETLSFAGIPALQHGNVIEVNTGVVGVEEACSGIRSLQATLMISIFFGEFYALSVARRFYLVGCGVAAAFVFNMCRTFFLTYIAARHGTEAVHQWHDTAGMSILLVCTVTIWLLALFLCRYKTAESTGPPLSGSAEPISQSPAASVTATQWKPWPMALALLLWVSGVEAGNALWFGAHKPTGRELQWSVQWPEDAPDYSSREMSSRVYDLLRYDRVRAGNWTDAEGREWQAIYLRWLPATTFYGRAKAGLAIGHNPEICMQSAGWQLEAELPPTTLHSLPQRSLVFQRYLFQADDGPWHVFFAVIEDQPEVMLQAAAKGSRLNRIRDALAGNRIFGQRVIEVAIQSSDSPEATLELFQREMAGWFQTTEVPDSARLSTVVQ